MMKTYLDDDSEALDGFEFLTMAEAGEVGHWAILKTLNETASHREITSLVEWALPIQERHFTDVQSGSLKLAGTRTPANPPEPLSTTARERPKSPPACSAGPTRVHE